MPDGVVVISPKATSEWSGCVVRQLAQYLLSQNPELGNCFETPNPKMLPKFAAAPTDRGLTDRFIFWTEFENGRTTKTDRQKISQLKSQRQNTVLRGYIDNCKPNVLDTVAA